MAGRINRPPWESSDMDTKPMLLYTPHRARQARDSADSFLPSGAVEYPPGPYHTWRLNGQSTMSGNGSSSRSSGTITGTGTGNGNGNDRYRDITTSPFGTTHFRTAYRTDAVTNGPTSMLPEPGAQTAYTEALLNRDSMPGPSRRPGLLSPFAPAYYPPTSTVAPAELTAGVRPMVSPPRASENAATNCGCLTCSDSTPARCSQSQLTQQYELMTRTWEEQRTFFEDFRVRLDIIYREEARITIGHYRTLWEAEKAQLNREIAYLNHQVQMLGDQNLRLRGQLADQVQYAEPIIHQGSFQGQGNTPMVDGSPPSPMASRHNGGARMYDSVRDSHWSPGMPSNFSNAFGLGSLESPRVPNFANRSPTASPVFPPIASPPSFPLSFPPSTRVSMSPQPGHETIPISPAFYPYSSSASPYPGMGTPGRSPKRPLSVIDVHELDPKLEGISLRASAVRKTTFEEPPSDGSPPSKRRRSLSHDYYIVNGPTGEDEETNVKKTEEDEEERRLTMYAGYTPNHSPSLPPANTSGLSQGSATPTASFVLPKSIDCPETEDRSATATVKEETGESSGVSYPDLSNHLRRVESSSSSSGSRSQTGRFPAPSSDVALNSDLSNPLRRVKSSSSDSRPQTGRFPAPSSDVTLNPDLFNPPRRVESSSSSSGSRSQTGRFPAPLSDVAPNLNLSNPLRRVESSSSGSRSQGMFSPPSGDVALKGPLMIKNIPAQDELFLAALNQRLEPISQGQDALPRAVQSPVAMPVPLSAVCSGSLDGANAKHTAVPDNTDVSGAQSEVDDEHNGVPIKMEHASSLAMDKKGKKKDVRYKRDQRAVRIKWPDPPQYGYDGTPILPDPENRDFIFITDTDDEELPAKAEATSSNPIKIDDSDDDSDTRISEPEVAIKFKSTSNFGAPFGRM